MKKRESKSCTVCQGSGEIKRVRKRKLSQDQRMQTNPKKHAHYEAPGPSPVGDQTVLTDSELYPEEEEEICYLVGKWRIYQHVSECVHRSLCVKVESRMKILLQYRQQRIDIAQTMS